MFSFLTPTDKFAFTWHGFYRDQKETILGLVWAGCCLGISRGQNAALPSGPFPGIWQKISELWGYLYFWEQLLWRIRVVERYEMGGFPSLLLETLQWPLASWHLISLGAICTMVNLRMIQLLGEDHSHHFLCKLWCSPCLVSALETFCSFLTCKCN